MFSKKRFAATSTKIKLLASAGLVGTAATVAGLGTYGTFTSTTTAASQNDNAGTVVIGLGSAGTATNRLTVSPSNLVPGDTVSRQVQLSNTGNQNLAGITLGTTVSPSNVLTTDTTNGLQMSIQSCPTAWTEAGTAPAYTYTCSGSVTTVLASTPALQTAATLSSLNSLTAGGVDNLVVTITFPSTAGNTFQGLQATLSFAFTGTQRTATAR